MSIAEGTSTILQRRDNAVAAAIAEVRRIETEMGVNREALTRIRNVLVNLADDRSLFPPEDFPLAPDGGNRIYRLSEDEDHRFALYMSVGQPGKETPPHNHTTWAVIVGVKGFEHNRFYERIDDGTTPGRGEVRETRRFTVQHGTGVTLLPDEIHSIHLEGEPPTLMLHMYGLSLDQLHQRVAFHKDGSYTHFPPNSNIVDAPRGQP